MQIDFYRVRTIDIMNMLKGVTVSTSADNKCTLFYIDEFSDELKQLLREKLSAICFGLDRITLRPENYSYKITLKQFWERYNKKMRIQKVGQLGELLTHILVSEILGDMEAISPFFNMEEGNVKKGFDVVMRNNQTAEVWMTEVKSGEAGEDQADKKNSELIHKAKRDLKGRLNEANTTIWYNAINGAKSAARKEIKVEVVDILENALKKVNDNEQKGVEHNVVLGTVVFKKLDDRAALSSMAKIREAIEKEKTFNKIIVTSVQKATLEKLEKFFREEVASV